MKYFIFLFITFFTSKLVGQDSLSQDSIYKFEQVDIEPIFQGGQEQFKIFLQKNIKYPKKSRKKKVEGRIFIQFVVEANGDITNIKILKGLDEFTDKEAIRVISIMPKWTPGKKNGKNIRTYFNLPIKFTLPTDY